MKSKAIVQLRLRSKMVQKLCLCLLPIILGLVVLVVQSDLLLVAAPSSDNFLMTVKVTSSAERTALAKLGVSIEQVAADYVVAIGTTAEMARVEEQFEILQVGSIAHTPWGFPVKDEAFHDYGELVAALKKLQGKAPNIVKLNEIGRSVENRIIYDVEITGQRKVAGQLPGIVFMGGHHAREHISIEMPLKLAQYLVNSYLSGDTRVVNLINSRVIHIIPAVNPDGAEFDIATGAYKWWRKNRFDHGEGIIGTDLNRNYGFEWGKSGASADPKSSTFRGPHAFSEPETQAIRAFIEQHQNIGILLSYHTFSELILYPWGHTMDSIADDADLKVHEKMAATMAQWNGYTPQQSSDLYVTSGDTTDWSYGVHGIISFTFELDPASIWEGGFYPGADFIQTVFDKNIEPALYLIDLADNPYRATEAIHTTYGLNSAILGN